MYGVCLRIHGDYACFTRPEMKSERVSYDVPTPSAIRGILEAIHWKPALRWLVDTIHVMKPVVFEGIRRNELGGKIPGGAINKAIKSGDPFYTCIEDDRQQRASLVLKHVDYIVEAHFELTDKAGPDDNAGKHLDIFNRRLAKGQVFHQPCFGCREFPAYVEPVEQPFPASRIADDPEGNRDLGWMLYDLDYTDGYTPMFFKAALEKGIVQIPKPDSPEVKR